MTDRGIPCHLCHAQMRDCGKYDGIWYFSCDDETCPTYLYKVKVITKPAKQEDGSYLSVI